MVTDKKSEVQDENAATLSHPFVYPTALRGVLVRVEESDDEDEEESSAPKSKEAPYFRGFSVNVEYIVDEIPPVPHIVVKKERAQDYTRSGPMKWHKWYQNFNATVVRDYYVGRMKEKIFHTCPLCENRVAEVKSLGLLAVMELKKRTLHAKWDAVHRTCLKHKLKA
ncbi:MAG: hypothetical protein FWE17_01165 [Alphaproteobacteria bacterium]|nr:hypothetical protein [Alphaproteobacteria bacterium]MCL2758302.1 hypothetical protein [Alphaproteobacteria bacterium]